MYLRRIEINNIRNVEHLVLDFPEPAGWHVLTGDNGSGKSTILQAAALAIMGPREALSLRLPFPKLVRKGEGEGSVEIQVERDWEVGDNPAISKPTPKPFSAGIKILKEGEDERTAWKIKPLRNYRYTESYLWSGSPGWFSASFGPFRNFTGGNEAWKNIHRSNPRAGAHLSIFGDGVSLTESLEWLRELNYQRLEGSQEAGKLLENIRRFINESQLLPQKATIDEVSSEGVRLRDGNGQRIGITEMGNSFRSVLSLALELMRQMVLVYGPNKVFQDIAKGILRITLPGVVLVDDIEAHLHPTWQSRIGQWFTKYFPNLQFIVSTLSPIICRAAEKGSIWQLAAPGSGRSAARVEGNEFKRLVYGNILEAYGTELFGEGITSSPQSKEMLEQLARLNKKSIMGTISPEEESRREQLLLIFSTGQSVK